MNMKCLCVLLSLMLVSAVSCGAANILSPSRDPGRKSLDAAALFERGKDAMERSQKVDSALLYFSAAVYKYDPENIPANEVRACVASYTNLGYLYFYHFNEYQKAYENITAALEVSERYGFHDYESLNLLNLGQLYILYYDFYQQKHYRDLAMQNFHRAFRKALQLKDYASMTVTFLAMAHNVLDADIPAYFYADMKLFASAPIPSSTPLYDYASRILEAIGCRSRGDMDGAADAMQEAYAIDTTPQDMREKLLAGLHLVKFRLLSHTGDGKDILDEMEKICADRAYVDLSIDVYRRLSDNFYSVGDSTAGDRYRFMYLENKDSLLTKSNMSSITHLSLQKNIEHMQRDMQRERHTHKVMTGVYFMIIGVLIIFIIGVLKMLRTKKEVAAKNLILYRQAREKLNADAPSAATVKVEEREGGNDKYRHSSLRDEIRKRDILAKINAFIDNNPAVYGDNFLIGDLAEAIGERMPHISQVINESYGKNFRSYLNEKRIRKACLMLENRENTKYTIEAIAGQLGFKSRSNFMMNFKKVMGLTPSEYRKIHESAPADESV